MLPYPILLEAHKLNEKMVRLTFKWYVECRKMRGNMDRVDVGTLVGILSSY